MALFRLETGDDAHDRRAQRDRVFGVKRAADVRLGVAGEVHAVVDEADRCAGAAFVLDLAHDRPGNRDQVVHARGQVVQELAIRIGTDAAGVHGADDERTRAAGRGEAPRSLRADNLRAVHVVVHDIRLDGGEMRRDRLDRGLVVHLLQGADGDAAALKASDRRSVRQGQDRDVVAGSVQARDEVEDVLLGAAAAAGGEQLHDPYPIAARGQRQAHHGLETGVGAEGARGDPQRIAQRRCVWGKQLRPAHARLEVRRTRTRWIGSSMAPHSYLYGSLPRSRSKRDLPRSIARRTRRSSSTTPGE